MLLSCSNTLKSFTKLAKRKETFVDKSAPALAREVFAFFKGLD